MSSEAPGTAPLAGSRWNHFFEHAGRRVVVNSVSMRAAAVDAELARQLASGEALAPSPAVLALRGLGVVAAERDDARAGLEALRGRGWAGPILDLFSLGPVIQLGNPPARQIARITESIELARQARELRTVKLRLSGASGAPLKRNLEVLAGVASACRERGLELISLLMSDALPDAVACADAPADAFFFRWRPASPAQDAAALDAVRALLRRGKLVAIQLAVRDLEALRAHEPWLRELAGDAALMRSPHAAWDVGLDAPERPYFLASVCHRDDAPAALLAEARGYLTALGVPVRPALSPFQFHPGCPLLLPEAHVLLPAGRRVGCNDDVTAAEPGPDPRERSAARAGAQLERDDCTRCASLPFCLARCPRSPAPEPGSPACAQVQRGARAELERLLAARLIHVEQPTPAPTPTPAPAPTAPPTAAQPGGAA